MWLKKLLQAMSWLCPLAAAVSAEFWLRVAKPRLLRSALMSEIKEDSNPELPVQAHPAGGDVGAGGMGVGGTGVKVAVF